MDSSKMKVLWMIVERGDRSFWTRIGIGSVNRDGSINLTIEAMPLGSAKIQLRDYTPRDADDETKQGASRGEGREHAPRRHADPPELRP